MSINVNMEAVCKSCGTKAVGTYEIEEVFGWTKPGYRLVPNAKCIKCSEEAKSKK